MKVYLAGRIKPNDWRCELTVEPSPIHDVKEWREVSELLMKDGNTLVGPFFIACDHGCYHGNCSHGAGILKCTCDGGSASAHEVFTKALGGIAQCDLFFVWAGEDFDEAHGTMVEIGYARAWNKRIVIGTNSEQVRAWFSMQAADLIVRSDNPIDAYMQATGQRPVKRVRRRKGVDALPSVLPLDEAGLLRAIEGAFKVANERCARTIYELEKARHWVPFVKDCHLCGKPSTHVKVVMISTAVSQACGAAKGKAFFPVVGLCPKCEAGDYQLEIERRKLLHDAEVFTQVLQ